MTAEPWRWDALANYNAERRRGIAHTAEYDRRMAEEQAAFDAEHDADMRRRGGQPVEEGGQILGWILPPQPRRTLRSRLSAVFHRA